MPVQKIAVFMPRGNFDDDLHITRVAEPRKLILGYVGASAASVGAVVVAMILTVAVATRAVSMA